MEEFGAIKAIIDVFNGNGVEFVFFNPGIDNVPLLETISAYRASGRTAPRSILCLDEFVAMTAAHGSYMASGRPQVVSVHSELGVLQIGGALHNARWGKVPVVFFTEIQGPPERTNWKGEAFDQGTMVRNFVKWDHQLTAGEDVSDVFQKAFQIANTEPCGPVYLALPRELFWSRVGTQRKASSVAAKEPPPEADIASLEKAAR
jgi:acetolactate synthase-1/2/3 large subunit